MIDTQQRPWTGSMLRVIILQNAPVILKFSNKCSGYGAAHNLGITRSVFDIYYFGVLSFSCLVCATVT